MRILKRAALRPLQPFWLSLLKSSLLGLGIGTGDNPLTSGERLVIRRFVPKDGVVIDVGANRGEYARLVIAEKPDVSLHCLEPSIDAVRDLKLNVPSTVRIHEIALSSSKGNRELYGLHGTGLASLHQRRLDHFEIALSGERMVETTTLDDFCSEESIAVIHLLKLDVEGHELEALKGASNLLKERSIHVIQFEFGGTCIDSRVYFQDFWYLLHDSYDIHRLLPADLAPIKRYGEWMEQFAPTNYVATLKGLRSVR